MEPESGSQVPANRPKTELSCVHRSIVLLDARLQVTVQGWDPLLFQGQLDVLDITQPTWAQFCELCNQQPPLAADSAAHWPLARQIARWCFLRTRHQLRQHRRLFQITVQGPWQAQKPGRGLPAEPCCPRPSPLQLVIVADLAEKILKKLNITQRQVLMMQVDGHGDKQIAGMTVMSVRTVRRVKRSTKDRVANMNRP